MHQIRRGLSTAAVAGSVLVLAAGALATGAVHYQAGSRAKGPYLFITVSNRTVTQARWRMRQTCDFGSASYNETDHLNAPIDSHGHFSAMAKHSINGSTFHTSFSGTIHGDMATVKVHDRQAILHLGSCKATRDFAAARTNSFR
jgi:hypothetical protein